MVFDCDGEFMPFPNCKFRETVLRVLMIPALQSNEVILAVVSKHGTVGLYSSKTLSLLHTYSAEAVLPTKSSKMYESSLKHRIHIFVDAVYADDLKMLMFATTRGQIICYDVGEIDTLSLGLDMLPRKEFRGMRHGVSPCQIGNKGHVETHRISGLNSVPSCLCYFHGGSGKVTSKILIGDIDGGITVIVVSSTKFPFLNCRKIRGTVHFIDMKELKAQGTVFFYKGHSDIVKDILLLEERRTVVSCSRDKESSVFYKDLTGVSESTYAALPIGATCLSHSDSLKLLIAGCDDGILQIFSYFSLNRPKFAINAHYGSIVGMEVITSVLDDPVLITYAEDVEIKAWNLNKLSCLQNQFIKFPRNLPIFCKTPEFGRKAVFTYTVNSALNVTPLKTKDKIDHQTQGYSNNQEFLILLYSNCYAKLNIYQDNSSQLSLLNIFYEELSQTQIRPREKQKKDIRLSQDPKIKLTETELKDIQNSARETRDKILGLKYEKHNISIEEAESKSPGISSRPSLLDQETDFQRGTEISEVEKMKLMKDRRLYHRIPYLDIKDPKPPNKPNYQIGKPQ